MALSTMVMGPWKDGLIASDPQEAIPHTALSVTENCEITAAGAARQRLGYDIYNAVLDAASAITIIGQVRFSASSSKVYSICADKFYEDASGTWTNRTGAVVITNTPRNYWSAASCFGTLFLCSETDGLAKWTAAGANLAVATCSSRFTLAKMNEYFDSLLWYANTNGTGTESGVWRSDTSSYETMAATNYYLTDGPVTGLRAFGQALMIHNEQGIWSLTPTGNTSIPYSRHPRLSIGAHAWRSVVTAPNNQQYFIRKDGVYEWNGGPEVLRISGPLDGSKYWDNLSSSYLQYSWAVVHPNKSWVIFAFPYGSSQTTLNHWMIFDYKYRRWFGPYKDYTRNCGALINNLPHAGSYAGKVYIHESGYDDDGTSIIFDMKTSAKPPEGSIIQHRWISARHDIDRAAVNIIVAITQSAESTVDNPSTINVVVQGDAIQTTFAVGSSAIAGSTEVLPVDTEMWGWDSGASFEYRHNQLGVPLTIRKVECLYETIEGTPLTKYQSGVI